MTPKVTLLTQFVPPEVVNYQWAPKGSYRIKQILGILKKRPNRVNMFTENGFAIYILNDYAVQLMPEI